MSFCGTASSPPPGTEGPAWRAPDRRTPHIEALKRLEHEADQVTHEVVNRLDRTFITPLDREDIHQLASDLDDVMDAMDGTARQAQIFRLGTPPQGVLRIVEVLQRMMAVLLEAVSLHVGKVQNQDAALIDRLADPGLPLGEAQNSA